MSVAPLLLSLALGLWGSLGLLYLLGAHLALTGGVTVSLAAATAVTAAAATAFLVGAGVAVRCRSIVVGRLATCGL